MKSIVYFTKKIEPESLIKLYQKLNVNLEPKIAIKVHTGEEGNQNYIKPDFYKDLVNNRLFNEQKTYEVFTRESVESKEYNILNNYSVVTFNDASSIEVSFSKNNKPLRDYFFEDNGKSYSSINGEKIKIYSYGKSYMTTFNYKGINFDIESSNISESDFLELLSLIIK